ncbi:protein NRT1/ PTR FAMILY 5.2-like [Triticum dicoccoides]|uniref:protein NRT1/ PTR FAMILY 5.2-like n=1 Tax=Triticum dicoccoides TaxID=85692 RepID=UPI000E7C085B|nr:protein NRT1/ PTR FAMILY 5.2-like [Triticum dicoccoides]
MAEAESLAVESGTGRQEYVQDGSVDLRGNPVLRSKRGGWTACSFIVVYELFERMAYYGIASNLFVYLTEKMHQGTVKASNNVTNWSGVVFITPLIGAHLADAYLGRYWTFVIGSAIYFMGMLLLTLAVTVGALKPPPCVDKLCPSPSALQVGVYFGGLYIVALGNGGTKPNISTMGADQFDNFDAREKIHKLSFFNWWMFTIFTGILFSSTVLVYLQDNVSWSVGYGIPTLGLVVSIVIFLVGTPMYRHKVPQGSAITRIGKVLAAALCKRRLPLPADADELHELEHEAYTRKRKFRMESTNDMWFLNKASVKDVGGASSTSKWSLCTVTEVEETKQILKLVPFVVTMFIPCTLIAQTNTLFVKQGTTMNRHMGPHFEIPPASLGAFVTLSMLITSVVYDRLFVKAARRYTNNPRGITLLTRMGIGQVIQVVTMATAALTENRRLSYARSLGLDVTGGQLPLTIFVLLPQYVLMGLADGFVLAGEIEFFYDQAPESMKSLGTALSLTAYGVGNVLSSFFLSLVARVTRERTGKAWVSNNLNASHLDYYYTFLTLLAVANCVAFAALASRYKYKVESTKTIDIDVDVQLKRLGPHEDSL